MASGETLVVFQAYGNEPPAASFATLDTRNQRPCLDFDAGATERAVFSGKMPQSYAGGGITAYIHVAASTDNNVAHQYRLDMAFENVASLDMDSDSFAAAQSASDNPNATLGVETITTIAFTDGAQMDSVTAGDRFRIYIDRDHDHGDDDMTGDLELYTVELRET